MTTLLELIDEAAATGATKFAPLTELPPGQETEIVALPPNIAKLKNVQSLEASDFQVEPSIVARRIDVLNGESFQSVVVWERGGRIETAVIADFIREIQTREAHDKVVRDAVDAWAKAGAVGT